MAPAPGWNHDGPEPWRGDAKSGFSAVTSAEGVGCDPAPALIAKAVRSASPKPMIRNLSKSWLVVAVVALVMGTAMPAFADYETGLRSYELGDYEAALGWYDRAISLSGGAIGWYLQYRDECAERKAGVLVLDSADERVVTLAQDLNTDGIARCQRDHEVPTEAPDQSGCRLDDLLRFEEPRRPRRGAVRRSRHSEVRSAGK